VARPGSRAAVWASSLPHERAKVEAQRVGLRIPLEDAKTRHYAEAWVCGGAGIDDPAARSELKVLLVAVHVKDQSAPLFAKRFV